MSRLSYRCCLLLVLAVTALSTVGDQSVAAPPGVETLVRPMLTGDELTRQPDIWAMEVYYKSLRMIWVDVPDPKTKKVKRELIWYLPYRLVNRQSDGALPPKGPDGKRPQFLPEFRLVTNDNDTQKIYFDEIIPAAQAEINRRERREYKNSVEIVGRIPELTKEKSKLERSIYGVAMWRGVDPKTDFFKVFMTGFSNGYKQVTVPGQKKPTVLRRSIIQDYKRPGDSLDEREREVKQSGRPKWIYN